MNKEKILVIDDEAGIRSSLKGILEDEGYSVKAVVTGEEALKLLQKDNFDLILLDIWLPEMNGIEILKKIKKMDENPQVVMISGHGTVETAVEAIKLGAHDFLEKPLSLEKVILTVKNSFIQKKLEEENIQLRESIRLKHHLIGKSHPVQKLRDQEGSPDQCPGSDLRRRWNRERTRCQIDSSEELEKKQKIYPDKLCSDS